MTCPTCGSEGSVRDSRTRPLYTRRRRVCENGHRFTTLELVVDAETMELRVPLMAVKANRAGKQTMPATMAMLETEGLDG